MSVAMSAPRRQGAKRYVDDLIRRFTPAAAPSEYWRLILAVRSRSTLLQSLSAAEQAVRACARMARYHAAWEHHPDSWKARDASWFLQFRSLANHLFDRYPTPRFMAPVWLLEREQPWLQRLYLYLAAGRSIRQFEFPSPFHMTKRSAAFFMQAPDDLHPVSAWRWGQVRSLGGNDELARLLANHTVLAAPTEHEPFWETVIRFLVKFGTQVDETLDIIRFIHRQKFQPAESVWGRGAGDQPLQPNFSLRGRTLRSLRRHMANWRSELLALRTSLAPPCGWQPIGIRPFHHESGDTLWTIDELLTDQELRVEGRVMRHCVATYASLCARRESSIWSMKVRHGESWRRALTIEVVPLTRTIRQAKGKRNASPTTAEQTILEQWAKDAGLRLL